jgi:hypothetical protein
LRIQFPAACCYAKYCTCATAPHPNLQYIARDICDLPDEFIEFIAPADINKCVVADLIPYSEKFVIDSPRSEDVREHDVLISIADAEMVCEPG